MIWQPERPTLERGKALSHSQEWQRAFVNEWCRLAEGRADPHQTFAAADELYRVYGARNPIDVAREDWGEPA